MRLAVANDLPYFENIRQAAFKPVFAFFHSILGAEIYAMAQAHEDEAQGQHLTSLLASDSEWQVYAAELDRAIIGFVSVQLNQKTKVGEIGLNAVHPNYAGQGIGTKMYDFAIETMKDAGMHIATVETGGDPSHAPARRAYEKAGFNVQISSVWLVQKL